jgi:RNA polymerase sigma factor (sigma-70 family)
LQDVFFKLWENKPPLKNAHDLSAWLFRVSYNTSITCLRGMLRDKKYVLYETQVSTYNSPDTQEPAEIRYLKEGLLHEAINLLPQRKRQVVDLCKFQGKSYAEAGSLMGIEKDTVKEYLTASMKFIRSYILSKEVS